MNIFNTIFPIFFLMFIGWGLAKANFFDESTEINLTKLVFNLALPAVILVSIEQYSIKNILNLRFAVGYTLSILIIFILTFCIFRYIKKYKFPDCIFIGMNASISNSGFIAMPILIGMFGTLGAIPAIAMLTVSSMVLIPVSIWIIESSTQYNEAINISTIFEVFPKIIRQPFILATIIGSIISICSLHIPEVVSSGLQYLSYILVPCALIAVGIRLATRDLFKVKSDIIYITILNLIIKPIFAILIAWILHLSKIYSTALVVISAAPVANTIYILAAKYNIYQKESAQIAFITTILSVISLPFFLWVASMVVGSAFS